MDAALAAKAVASRGVCVPRDMSAPGAAKVLRAVLVIVADRLEASPAGNF